jgi:hypothetical protein
MGDANMWNADSITVRKTIDRLTEDAIDRCATWNTLLLFHTNMISSPNHPKYITNKGPQAQRRVPMFILQYLLFAMYEV